MNEEDEMDTFRASLKTCEAFRNKAYGIAAVLSFCLLLLGYIVESKDSRIEQQHDSIRDLEIKFSATQAEIKFMNAEIERLRRQAGVSDKKTGLIHGLLNANLPPGWDHGSDIGPPPKPIQNPKPIIAGEL